MQVQLTRTRITYESPSVLIDEKHFIFNAAFTKLAKLDEVKSVKFFIEEENRRISFQFFKDKQLDAWAVYINGHGYSYRTSADAIINKYYWLKSIASLKKSLDRSFKAVSDGKFWIIQLRPSFEFHAMRSELNIPLAGVGIYKLLDKNSNTVYIGRGQIRRRINEHINQNWIFDSVDFSLVSDTEKQKDAESYWIERHKSEHDDQLPFYNKVSGKKSRGGK